MQLVAIILCLALILQDNREQRVVSRQRLVWSLLWDCGFNMFARMDLLLYAAACSSIALSFLLSMQIWTDVVSQWRIEDSKLGAKLVSGLKTTILRLRYAEYLPLIFWLNFALFLRIQNHNSTLLLPLKFGVIGGSCPGSCNTSQPVTCWWSCGSETS